MEEADMNSSIPFSEDFKRILQQTMDLVEKSGSPTVHYEHLVLAAINDKHSKISEYLEHLNFDIEKSKPLIEKLVQRKTKQDMHPELDENREKEVNLTQETDSLFDNKESSKVFERAVSKLSTSGYEILGTEQIISSILKTKILILPKYWLILELQKNFLRKNCQKSNPVRLNTKADKLFLHQMHSFINSCAKDPYLMRGYREIVIQIFFIIINDFSWIISC